MSGQTLVTVIITPVGGGPTTARELGEFHAVWRKGVSIGNDAQCTISLPGLAPVAAIVLAASNHKLLYLPGAAGLDWARDLDDESIPQYDARVDYSSFEVGPYRLQFGEKRSGGDD